MKANQMQMQTHGNVLLTRMGKTVGYFSLKFRGKLITSQTTSYFQAAVFQQAGLEMSLNVGFLTYYLCGNGQIS